MKTPAILSAVSVMISKDETEIRGTWYPARPLPYYSWQQRWKAAWLVFTGKADALIWPAHQ